MNLEEFYQRVGGSYDQVLLRLMREDLVRRFLGMFFEDEAFGELVNAMDAGDDAAAFEAVHKLKGNALNVGLGALGGSASALTEALRNGRKPEADALYLQVVEDYRLAVDAYRQLV